MYRGSYYKGLRSERQKAIGECIQNDSIVCIRAVLRATFHEECCACSRDDSSLIISVHILRLSEHAHSIYWHHFLGISALSSAL